MIRPAKHWLHSQFAAVFEIKISIYLFAELKKVCSLEAEREGFEPPAPFGAMVFKTTALSHSAIFPEHKRKRWDLNPRSCYTRRLSKTVP